MYTFLFFRAETEHTPYILVPGKFLFDTLSTGAIPM